MCRPLCKRMVVKVTRGSDMFSSWSPGITCSRWRCITWITFPLVLTFNPPQTHESSDSNWITVNKATSAIDCILKICCSSDDRNRNEGACLTRAVLLLLTLDTFHREHRSFVREHFDCLLFHTSTVFKHAWLLGSRGAGHTLTPVHPAPHCKPVA